MKTIILFLFLICSSPFVFSQNMEQSCEKLTRINQIIQAKHYRPKVLNDSMSVFVFDSFFEKLDDNNSLFIEPEIKILKQHRLNIDNYIITKNCNFLDDIYNIYTNAVIRYKKNLEFLIKQPFAESSQESMRFSKDNFQYHADEAKLKSFHSKFLLYEYLKEVSLVSLKKDSILANYSNISKKAKTKIFESSICNADKLMLKKEVFLQYFYTTFCTYFDPHTTYFSKNQKSEFLSSVSSDNLSFGMYLSLNNKNEVVVVSVLPGSSAYFSEKILEGDVITGVKIPKETVEISCSTINKIEEILNASEIKVADFVIRNKNGEINTITLSKKVIKDYQNNVYSYILEKDKTKTGYINIPSFYDTFENGKNSVTSDLVTEILKLKEDKIDNLILDFQNNGGGSMEEAIKMCGLFIDAGPIAIMNNSLNKKTTLKDSNRGTAFDGELVILINGFSASASEFFVNAMQDYNRAIIIGSQSLGKATMQNMFPVDNQNEDFVKVTLEKFYRITGKSNQYIGIKPDVEIATLFEKQIPSERSYKTAIKNDVIEPVTKYTIIENLKFKEIIAKSQKRVNLLPETIKIKQTNLKINNLYDNKILPLKMNFTSVFDFISQYNKLSKEVKEVSEIDNNFQVTRNSLDIEYQEYDEYLTKSNMNKIKLIKANPAILEALNIISELKSK